MSTEGSKRNPNQYEVKLPDGGTELRQPVTVVRDGQVIETYLVLREGRYRGRWQRLKDKFSKRGK